MRKVTTILLVLLLPAMLIANPIDKQTALKVAKEYLSVLKGKSALVKAVYPIDHDGFVAIYAVEAENGGFVLVAGDDNVKPVLGYSSSSNFIYPIESPEVKWWIEGMATDIYNFSRSNMENPEAKKLWDEFLKGDIKTAKAQVGPLVKTTWNQTGGGDYPYNYYCPTGTPVGCVATATIQVMKYWEYPVHGTGWYGYEEGGYGFLAADLERRDLDWSDMPLDASNPDVALIGYQVGVTLRMDYSPSGSGSYTYNLVYILPNFFGYDHGIMYYSRSYFSDAAWKDTLKVQLDNGQPMVYSGSGDAGGHAFVCDGYNDQDYFHFNWGWGGAYDGFYSLDALTPGSYSFTSSQSAVVNIKPAVAPNRLLIGAQSGAANGAIIKEIYAYNKQVAYAVSSTGQFLRTRTGGIKWTELSVPSVNFTDLYVLSADTLYMTYGGKVMYSYDAAKTWNELPLPENDLSWTIARFETSKKGYVAAASSTGIFVYGTLDGGQTWSLIHQGTDPEEKIIGKTGNYKNFVTNLGRVYHLADFSASGSFWNISDLVSLSADQTVDVDIDVVGDNGFAYVSGDVSGFFNSSNGGVSWSQITPGITSALDIAYDTSGILYMVNDDNMIKYSADNGNTWIDLPDYYGYFVFYSVDGGNDGYVYFGSKERPWSPGMWIKGVSYTADVSLITTVERSCAERSLSFMSSTNGMVDSVVWYFGEGADPEIARGASVSVSYSDGGVKTAKVVAYSPDGVASDYRSFFLDENLPPMPDSISGDNIVILENKYNFSVPKENNVEYVWVLPTGWSWGSLEHDTADVAMIPKGTLGGVTIKAAYKNGCGATDYAEKTVTVVAGNEQVAYPNPTSDFVNIENAENAKVEVYSYNGRLLKTFVSNSYLYKIDLSDLNNGAYFVKVYRPGKDPVVFKVIVNK